jgi:hypothetical protein
MAQQAKRAQVEAKLNQLIQEQQWQQLLNTCEQYEFEVLNDNARKELSRRNIKNYGNK